jgi:hypothetical protein
MLELIGGWFILPDDATMIDILFEAQIFPSRGQARKNWKGPMQIPFGSNLFTLGKLKKKVFVHKAFWAPLIVWG